MAKKVKENNEVSAVRRSKHGGVLTVFFSLLTVFYLYPIFLVLINSFKKKGFITKNAFALPDERSFTGLSNFIRGIEKTNFFQAFGYSVLITVGSVAVIILCTSMCAWYITRVHNKVNATIYMLCLFSMIVPFQMVMFTLSKLANMMHLSNPVGIILVYLGFGAGLAVFMFCGFVKSIPIEIFETEIFDSVYNVEKSPCYLCARMRRGYLYSFAKKFGCNKIALGHHYDDVIETILMGMLWGAQVQTMMPKLHSTNFEGMELIRPLYLIREDDIKAWRDANELHFIQCACKFTDTCTTCRPNEETKSKRLQIKQLIRELKKTNPEVEAHIFRSMENVCLDTVLAYKTGGRKVSFLDGYDEKTRKPEAEMPAAEPERCM